MLRLSAGVAAREIKMSSPNSGACKDAAVVAKGEPAAMPARAEARETRIKPSIHSDTATRVSSPRWHSFLPGMFR